MASKLFVGNLPFTTTENDLQDHFAQAGSVIAVNIMQDRATGRSRGFAFVEMGSQEDATKAIQMFHQKDFQGRALTVNEARPREPRDHSERGPRRAGVPHDPQRRRGPRAGLELHRRAARQRHVWNPGAIVCARIARDRPRCRQPRRRDDPANRELITRLRGILGDDER